ncbi:hypothetical protein [Rhizobium rhizoryzae]|uniref:Uncharacterized protein n=1 Tax=Rhizobium rhizoryzae TaxID=451876 RepID=A0A7W6PS92_9HYPH|nr:hypothetical protein [Rhizobium rhizoryzae]MBB4143832.1 hypothetical protein [Rhizobium rhizoryzae]
MVTGVNLFSPFPGVWGVSLEFGVALNLLKTGLRAVPVGRIRLELLAPVVLAVVVRPLALLAPPLPDGELWDGRPPSPAEAVREDPRPPEDGPPWLEGGLLGPVSRCPTSGLRVSALTFFGERKLIFFIFAAFLFRFYIFFV